MSHFEVLLLFFHSKKIKNKVVLKIQKQTISRKILNSFVREETGTLCWDQKVHQFRPLLITPPSPQHWVQRADNWGKNVQFSQRIIKILIHSVAVLATLRSKIVIFYTEILTGEVVLWCFSPSEMSEKIHNSTFKDKISV